MNSSPAPAPVKPAPVAKVEPAPEPKAETLTNDGVIQMVTAKVPLEVIYNQMRSVPTDFKFSVAELGKLSQAGVSAAMIEAMRDPKNIPAPKTAPKTTETAKAAPKAGPGTTTASSPTATTPASTTPAAAVTPTPTTVASTMTTPAPAPPATPAARPEITAGKQVVMPDGTPFLIALEADIPENAKPGSQLRFHVLKDEKVGDTVLIPKGSLVLGQIAQGKRMFGKMTLRLLTVTGVDGKLHKIRALSARNNKEPERPVETNAKPKGDKVAADAGTEYTAYIDGEMTVTVTGKR
jgi:hypothetical protein